MNSLEQPAHPCMFKFSAKDICGMPALAYTVGSEAGPRCVLHLGVASEWNGKTLFSNRYSGVEWPI